MLRHLTITAATTAILLSVPQMAQADSVLRMLSRSGLVQQDIDIMAREASKLYLGGVARPGNETTWSNPATGAGGTARLTAVEGNCVDIAYGFSTRTRPAERTVTLRRCRSGDQWVLSN